MSVTFSISNFHPNTDLGCCDESDCPICKGTNKLYGPDPKWYLNLTNGNFVTLASGLGLPYEGGLYGVIEPLELRKLLMSYDPELGVREEREEQIPWGPRVINCALPLERVYQYVEQLLNLCYKAVETGGKIQWG